MAIVKLAAAAFTGSAAIAAEGVHSLVDVGSGGLMLYGYRRSRLGPDRRHPLGRSLSSAFGPNVVLDGAMAIGVLSWVRERRATSAGAHASARGVPI